MLCQFTFQNFKSYKSETTLDFQATALPEFKDTLITEAPASDLLPVSVVYGPNGGGKSNRKVPTLTPDLDHANVGESWLPPRITVIGVPRRKLFLE